jgi:type III secretion protein C
MEELDLYAPEEEPMREGYLDKESEREDQTILINFNNVGIVEFIRFASRSTGKNFVFDENDLQFNVSIISEEPTTISNIMTALMQELRIHGLSMMEQGNNVIIYSNNAVSGISKVVDEHGLSADINDSEIITQVFRLNTTDAAAAAAVIKPLTSESSIIDVIEGSNHLIVTDLTANVRKIGQLIRNFDSPKSGLVVGQYVVKNDFVDGLTESAKGIMGPLTGEQSLTMVPHSATNSIFIVGSPYLVEKSIQVMRYLDQNESSTRLLDQDGRWILDDNGQWIFRTGAGGNQPPNGGWYIDEDGNWIFRPGEKGSGQNPDGVWELDENGNWVYRLKPGQTIAARKLNRPETDRAEGLPLGHIEKAQFTIFKLKYRKGDQVSEALRNIGETLQNSEALNQDFINSINTVQWIESSNSLIFTGTPAALSKVIEFIHEIDIPLRQVFIEMLIMDMTLTDSLIYGVNWGTQLGGGNVALGESFVSGVSQINNFLTSAANGTPTVDRLARIPGYRLGVIGKHLSRGGIQFDTVAALVKATHQDEDTRILMNPKIFTEENYAAEVFVGLEVQYPTQSIANDFGNVITQNFESKDIGTKLRVTPIIGNNDVITIDIHQEVSNVAGLATQVATQSTSTAGPTIVKSTTTTRVHVPNGFFVAISGEIRDEDRRRRDNVPCLGAIPFLGAFFSEKEVNKSKRNLMIFMRPQIIDTEEQIDTLTSHQQNVWQNASYSKKNWEFEVDEALDLMNLKTTKHQRYDGCDTDQCY